MADTNSERVDKALDLLKGAICGGLSLLSGEQDIPTWTGSSRPS